MRGVEVRLQWRVRNSRLAVSLEAQRWRPRTFAARMDVAGREVTAAEPADRMSSRCAVINHRGACWNLFSLHDSASR